MTEEITGVDIVASQIKIAGGASLADLGFATQVCGCGWGGAWVHWVYDLQLLVSLQEERCAQVGQEGAICMGQGGVRVRLLGKIAGGRWSFTWRIYPYYCRLLLIPHQQGIEGLEFMDPPRR